jgi:hypothetical protein
MLMLTRSNWRAAAVLAIWFAPAVVAQTPPNWTQLFPQTSPPPRAGFTFAYDSVRNQWHGRTKGAHGRQSRNQSSDTRRSSGLFLPGWRQLSQCQSDHPLRPYRQPLSEGSGAARLRRWPRDRLSANIAPINRRVAVGAQSHSFAKVQLELKCGADWPQLPSFGPSTPRFNSNSHSTPITRSRRLLKALLSCHSCLVINYIAINRCAHNPKVGGSNPSPATTKKPSKSITYLSR